LTVILQEVIILGDN